MTSGTPVARSADSELEPASSRPLGLVGQILAYMQGPEGGNATVLNDALRLLAKWRCAAIQRAYLQRQGVVVAAGPFAGMLFLPQSAEGCHLPKLLGCYEQLLHPLISEVMRCPYEAIVNIGCAEGYYAVGMARGMPEAQVYAYDLNPRALQACRGLAEANGVADRVQLGSRFEATDFARHRRLLVDTVADQRQSARILVICDIEGAEAELLNPQQVQDLASMDLIVESHECLKPGLTQTLMNRFKLTHDVLVIEDHGQRQLTHTPAWFRQISHLDQLLAVWEWRSGPTPWLWMRARQGL